MSVHWPIIRRCLKAPGTVAMVDDQRTWRRVEVLWAAMHLAALIERSSATKHVGVLLPTSGLFPVATLACWMLGRVPIPLNYLLSREEMKVVLDDCDADAVVTVKPMLDYVGGLPGSQRIVLCESMNVRALPDPRLPAFIDEDENAVVLYTSGTSGKPKGVQLTHHNIRSNIRQAVSHASFDHRDTLLGVLPQFHSFGMTVLTFLPLMMGIKAVYTARFVPQRIIKLMHEHRPTAFVGIPSMYGALLKLKNAGPGDFRSLRLAVSGGEPLPQAISDDFAQRFGVRISEGYGLTETSPVTNVCMPSEFRSGSVGRVVPGLDMRIVEPETGALLGANADGEVRFRGPNVMRGYYKRPQETAAAFDEHGYFRTGDIGRRDSEGHLYITGRIKEMMIVGGENVFPREIEEVLNQHPDVHASGVIGLPDPMRGETPVAFVELNEDAVFDEAAIKAFCRQRIAGYKVPREIYRVDQLPRNPTGKIMRRALSALLPKDVAETATA